MQIEAVRSEEDFRAKAEKAWQAEISRAQSMGSGLVSAKAAAWFLGIHADTLGEWRRRTPPMGPRFMKASGSAVNGPNQRVKYDYDALVEWKDGQQASTPKERRLLQELDLMKQQLRVKELERQLHEARQLAAKAQKNAGRYVALDSYHDCFVEAHAWAFVGGRIAGHVLTVSDEVLDQALDAGEVWESTLADALLEPWASPDSRDPFDAAMESAISAYERARSDARSQDRAHAMQSRLPAATGPGTRKPFRF